MNSLKTDYTLDEIKSIKKNLKAAFGVSRLQVYTTLKELYRDADSIFIHNKEKYYVFFPMDVEEFNKKKGWYAINITYKRSGVIFFKFENENKEFFFIQDSLFIQHLVPAKIRLSEFNIPDRNLELIKFNRSRRMPFKIEIIKNDGSSFEV